MKTRLSLLFCGCLLILSAPGANAIPLNPNDPGFTSLGLLDGAAITIDTDALTFNGGAGGTLVDQSGVAFGPNVGGPADIAVFLFDGNSILGDVIISGSNAAAILFLGDATISGSIDAGARVTGGATSGGEGGPGAGQGGRGFSGLANERIPGSEQTNGFGPGGGEKGNVDNGGSNDSGGAGGGFGTKGGDAGAGIGAVDGGAPYGDLILTLEGGSGGGGGGGFQGFNFRGGNGGGGGGGALEIGALGTLLFEGALISADGGDGKTFVDRNGGGGGSGGGLLFHGFDITVDVDTIITANGGDGGGTGGTVGGCGGGGLIMFLNNTAGAFGNDGTVTANPGDGIGTDCDPTTTNIAFLTSPDIGEAPNQQPGTSVPEPHSGLLFGLGLAGLLLRRRKTR